LTGVLELSSHLREVASRVLESGSNDDDVSMDEASENLDKLDGYLRAKRSVPILVVNDNDG
jgi:hypothetical protein